VIHQLLLWHNVVDILSKPAFREQQADRCIAVLNLLQVLVIVPMSVA
jgi:hypothetical protein